MAKTIEYRTFVSELAARAYSDVGKRANKDNYSIDPMTILAIVSVILQIVKFIMEWYNNNFTKAAQSAKKMGWFTKWMLWRYCRKEAKNKKEARYIYDGILETVYNMSDEERTKLFNLAR